MYGTWIITSDSKAEHIALGFPGHVANSTARILVGGYSCSWLYSSIVYGTWFILYRMNGAMERIGSFAHRPVLSYHL